MRFKELYERVYNAEVVHVWPTEEQELAVVISGETKHDKN